MGTLMLRYVAVLSALRVEIDVQNMDGTACGSSAWVQCALFTHGYLRKLPWDGHRVPLSGSGFLWWRPWTHNFFDAETLRLVRTALLCLKRACARLPKQLVSGVILVHALRDLILDVPTLSKSYYVPTSPSYSPSSPLYSPPMPGRTYDSRTYAYSPTSPTPPTSPPYPRTSVTYFNPH